MSWALRLARIFATRPPRSRVRRGRWRILSLLGILLGVVLREALLWLLLDWWISLLAVTKGEVSECRLRSVAVCERLLSGFFTIGFMLIIFRRCRTQTHLWPGALQRD